MTRPAQRVVSVLRSYSVPIPDFGSRERVIYDTSVDKNTLRVSWVKRGELVMVSPDFPEAFERFEQRVDISRFDSYRQLFYAFGWWTGKK